MLRFIIFFCTISICGSSGSSGQTGSVSPYSRYGIGEIQPQGLIHHRASGGTGVAWNDVGRINTLNPATQVYDTSTVFEVAFDAEFVKISNDQSSTNASSGTFGYFALGFPVIKHKWSSIIGLNPLSSTGYKVSVNEELENIGNVEYIYEGDGGLSRFYLSNGFRMTRNLSVSATVSYYFGTIKNIKSVEFPQNEDYFNSRYTDALTANDFQFDAGMHYNIPLKDKRTFSIGIVASIPSDLKAKQNITWFNYTTSAFGFDLIKDSVVTITDREGEISLPSYYRLGVMYDSGKKFRLGADFSHMNWEEFQKFEIKDSLSNSYSIHAGGEYSLEKIRFMAGARYAQTYLDLRNEQLTDISASFGISLVKLFSIKPPILISMAFEFGKRGTTDSNLIEEQYTRFTFGLTVSDIWFIKPKYD